MSHPVLWPRQFFYAIGNTPPVCLTQNVPPEKSADVLLLGCGDPRSILYTLHVDWPAQRPRLDITCCDDEPAVLARNILLFTLIYDGHSSDHIWNVFYHIKVDKTSFSLLISQSRKLLDISVDFDAWKKSEYSWFLQFCTRSTLHRLRHYWNLYVQTELLTKAKQTELFTTCTREFKRRHGTPAIVSDAARSAGPFCADAVHTLSKHFSHYWKTGIVSRSATDIKAAIFINPTLVYSDAFTPSVVGDGCALHYSSYPLQSFHLASTFVTSPSLPTNNMTETQLVTCAMSQFREWCRTFAANMSSRSHKSIVIRLFVGDALALCHTLSNFRSTSVTTADLYVTQWKGARLVLDGSGYGDGLRAPTTFNVIDTSNIADHVGLMNVLISAVPLIAQDLTSVLYTEVRFPKGQDRPQDFIRLLCADVPTIGLLLGVFPAGYVARFTSNSQLHEMMLDESYRERVAWRMSYHADSLINDMYPKPSFSDPLALAKIFLSTYCEMFRAEWGDFEEMMSRSEISQSIIDYDRGTFCTFLGLVKSRVETDWTSVMDKFFELLHADSKFIWGLNKYQELCCQLYLRGIYSVGSLRPERALVVEIDRGAGLFKGWKEVPPVVCVVLVVPRVLEDMEPQKLPSPAFQCEVLGRKFQNMFSCIQVILGNVSVRGSGYDCRVTIAEDAQGWFGTSPLVISVLVPAFILVSDPQATRIAFSIHPTPVTVMMLSRALDSMLTVFAADVTDKRAVHVVLNRPDHVLTVTPTPITPVAAHKRKISVAIAEVRVSTMTGRWDLKEDGASDTFVNSKVETKQVSPCVMQVLVNDVVQKQMVYAFPINGIPAKVRIARKSGWIEIEAPVRRYHEPPTRPVDFAATTLLTAKDQPPVLWNIHRVNIASLPIIKVNQHNTMLARQTAAWIKMNVSMAFSDRERAVLEQETTSTDVLVQVKDSLLALFNTACQPHAPQVYSFSGPDKSVYAILYLNSLRMDLASHAVVADTCVLSALTKKAAKAKPSPAAHSVLIPTSEEEVVVWKHLLVAFTERCRTWNHTPTCRYASTGRVPVSVEMHQNPLCSCGEGIDLGSMSEDESWKALAPFMTRAAISPLFAISYLEKLGGAMGRALSRYDEITSNTVRRNCFGCGKSDLEESKLLLCGGCKAARYCGKDCQKASWKQHKILCKTVSMQR
ncbi:hypothetical protein B0H10DRAFT_2004878 [Mycena sp. CBHHK59/15]|nr:hypothetical protein B0H10DRAFT_2004878 [Mycena sp. CBHHK59/15]